MFLKLGFDMPERVAEHAEIDRLNEVLNNEFRQRIYVDLDSFAAKQQRLDQSDAAAPEWVKHGVARLSEGLEVLLNDAPQLLCKITVHAKVSLCPLLLEVRYFGGRRERKIVEMVGSAAG